MIVCQTSGQYDGTRFSDYVHARDIRLRLNDFGTMDMHIQHPVGSVLGDPIEFTQDQVANLACTLAQLDRSLRGVYGEYDDNDWEGDPNWQHSDNRNENELNEFDDNVSELQEWHDYDPDC